MRGYCQFRMEPIQKQKKQITKKRNSIIPAYPDINNVTWYNEDLSSIKTITVKCRYNVVQYKILHE